MDFLQKFVLFVAAIQLVLIGLLITTASGIWIGVTIGALVALTALNVWIVNQEIRFGRQTTDL